MSWALPVQTSDHAARQVSGSTGDKNSVSYCLSHSGQLKIYRFPDKEDWQNDNSNQTDFYSVFHQIADSSHQIQIQIQIQF